MNVLFYIHEVLWLDNDRGLKHAERWPLTHSLSVYSGLAPSRSINPNPAAAGVDELQLSICLWGHAGRLTGECDVRSFYTELELIRVREQRTNIVLIIS